MAREKRTEWLGGWIHHGEDGKPYYYLRKKKAGKAYRFALGVHTEEAALKEYKLWETDPENYTPPQLRPATDALLLDLALVSDFLKWSRLSKAEGGKGNTPKWVTQQRLHLAWWILQLDQRQDLRKLSTDTVLSTVQGKPMRAHRLRVLSALFGWLRKHRHVIDPSQDPFFGKIQLPQASPVQESGRSNVVPYKSFMATLKRLMKTPANGWNNNQHWAWGLLIQAGTGWHAEEVRRFAEEGSFDEPPRGADEDVAGVIVTSHKDGKKMHRTQVNAYVFKAAELLRAHGSFDVSRYADAIREAAASARVKPWLPRQLRASTATWAVDSGTDLETIATYLGQRSKSTTLRFYARYGTPRKVPTMTDRMTERTMPKLRLLKNG